MIVNADNVKHNGTYCWGISLRKCSFSPHRHHWLPIALILTVMPSLVSGTDVPGSGAAEFLRQFIFVFGGFSVAGIITGFLSKRSRAPVLISALPPVLGLALAYFGSHEFGRHGNLGVAVVGVIPYIICYGIGRWISRFGSKNNFRENGR